MQNGKNHGITGDAFVASLSAEVDRLRLFITAQLEQVWVQLLDHICQLQGISAAGVARGDAAASAADVLRDMEASLDAFGELISLWGRNCNGRSRACFFADIEAALASGGI